MLQEFSGFFKSATYPLQTLAIFRRHPRLWGYILTPILVNCLIGIFLYAGLLLVSWQGINELMLLLANRLDKWIVNLPQWLSWLDFLIIGLGWLLRFLFVFILLLIVGYLTLTLGSILGAPWYGKLSEQLEEIRLGKLNTIEVSLWTDIWRALMFELKKLLLLITIGGTLFLIGFIPVAGTVISAIGYPTLAATIACLDFTDAAAERRRLSFRRKLGLVWKNFPSSASFSLVCLGLISIPLLNFFTIPFCVASGTLFWCDRIFPKLPSS
ncbi:MAG: EI24 domain-containing protein [Spirulinaceae cyanobacterium]